MHDEVVDQKVQGILETTGVVPGEAQMHRFDLLLFSIDGFSLHILYMRFDNVLISKLVENLRFELGGAQVLTELLGHGEG